eukprot:TRINITY_DN2924_c0_g1_i1.p1 TRINITY_DN2924_c0_g1~~TRINITY_DN2924_c0_g1_i1.p1  ORF type:complete len:383 (-),score=65.32 TRINITY_DN2924_c0_g1_i1:98-1246(-)
METQCAEIEFPFDINSLPSEILAHMFSFLMYEGEDELRKTEEKWNNLSRSLVLSSRVCLHWRNNIVNLPHWNDFSLFIKGLYLIPSSQDNLVSFLNQPSLKEVPELTVHGVNKHTLEVIPNLGDFEATNTWKAILEESVSENRVRKILELKSIKILRVDVTSKEDYLNELSVSDFTTLVIVRDAKRRPIYHTLEHFSTIENLESLTLEGNWFGVNARPLSILTNLKILSILGVDIILTPQSLSTLTKLKGLQISKVTFSQEVWDTIQTLHELEDLVVNLSVSSSESTFRTTTPLPKLKTLAVFDHQLPIGNVFAFIQPYLPTLGNLGIFGKSCLTRAKMIEILNLASQLRAMLISKENRVSENDIEDLRALFPNIILKVVTL